VTTPIAIAPGIATYDTRTSYITVQEFKDSPTAVELSNLVLDGSSLDEDEALAVAIERASSWADALTYQTISATVNTSFKRARVRPDGTVRVALPFKPVIAVLGISTGPKPSMMSPITGTPDIVIGEHGVIEFPVFNTVNGYRAGGVGINSNPLVQVIYVNGWANSLTSGPAAAGDLFLPVQSTVGIYAGAQLKIYDGARTESVVVAAGYVPGAPTLPLIAPLRFAHDSAGISVSALPARVKQAVVLLTSALIETAGNDSIVLSAMAEPGSLANEKGASAENIALAMDMLDEFKRVW
jgi:hypothetical protein